MNTIYKHSLAAGLAMMALVAAYPAGAAEAPAPVAAAPMQASGKVHAVDVVNLVIKMEGGQFYLVPPSIDLTALKEGDQITLTGEKDANGRMVVKSVTKK